MKLKKHLVCKFVISLIAGTMAHTALCAESATSNSVAPPARVAIRAGRLLNPRTGQFTTNAVLVIEGERIGRSLTLPP